MHDIIVENISAITSDTSKRGWYKWRVHHGTKAVYFEFRSTSRLMNQKIFLEKCVKQLNYLPPKKRAKDWEQFLNDCLNAKDGERTPWEWN